MYSTTQYTICGQIVEKNARRNARHLLTMSPNVPPKRSSNQLPEHERLASQPQRPKMLGQSHYVTMTNGEYQHSMTNRLNQPEKRKMV